MTGHQAAPLTAEQISRIRAITARIQQRHRARDLAEAAQDVIDQAVAAGLMAPRAPSQYLVWASNRVISPTRHAWRRRDQFLLPTISHR